MSFKTGDSSLFDLNGGRTNQINEIVIRSVQLIAYVVCSTYYVHAHWIPT
jgi:hypothetical protein